MPTQRVGDIDIHWQHQGEGPRLLFITGTGSDLRNRPGVFDGPYPKAFDLVAYDQRGLGQTSKPDAPYSMAQYGDDAAALMDALRVPSAAYEAWLKARKLHLPTPEAVREYARQQQQLAQAQADAEGAQQQAAVHLRQQALEAARLEAAEAATDGGGGDESARFGDDGSEPGDARASARQSTSRRSAR